MAEEIGRVKKPHYVAQGYLREFALGEQINVFDKVLRRQFVANIRDICSERTFYDDVRLDELAGKKQPLESFFHGFEDAGVRAIRQTMQAVRAGTFSGFSDPVKIDLALYLAIQHLRTKRMPEEAARLLESITERNFVDYVKRTQPELPIEDVLGGMTLHERGKFATHLYLMTSEEMRVAVSSTLLRRAWVLFHNQMASPLYTSDHPLAEDQDCSQRGTSDAAEFTTQVVNAFESPGVFRTVLPDLVMNLLTMGAIIAFPLAPDGCLVLLDTARYSRATAVCDSAILMDPGDFTYYNRLQSEQALRQVYSRDANFNLLTSAGS